MENDRKTITANEINKFTYCPYQWYYERFYGRKELRRLAKERNTSMNMEDARLSNLKSGTAHHNRVYRSYRFKTTAIRIFVIIVILIIIYFFIRG